MRWERMSTEISPEKMMEELSTKVSGDGDETSIKISRDNDRHLGVDSDSS
jgi:hypothetical protein